MIAASELQGGYNVSERTRHECQHYAAIWTIVRALKSIRAADADDFDLALVVQWEAARDTITPEEDHKITGPLVRELRDLGALREHGRARVVRRRRAHA